jgi:superfamily II DNA or RNA helicase
VIKEKITIGLNGKNGIIICDHYLLKLVREKFSVPNPSYTARKFSPRKYIITPSGSFEIGLFHEIRTYIESLDIPIELVVLDDFANAFSPKYGDYEIENIDGFTYYDHQKNTIAEFLKYGRGIGLLATASGKALIIGGLVKTLLKYNNDARILIIVPNTSLLNQLYYSFIDEFNLPVISRFGDKNVPDWGKNVIIANSQILTSDIPYSVDKFKDFDCVIVDEVHRLGEKNNQINKVVHNIPTHHRFGLTGTLPDNLLATWNVVGKIGPILYEESSYDIRQKGTASEIKIKIIICEHQGEPEKPVRIGKNPLLPTAYYNKEKEFVYSNGTRNEIIHKIAHRCNGNVLILVDTIDHGTLLYNKLSTGDKQVFFIQGSTDTAERARIIDLMEESDNIICIAMSQIFSTGISIKNLPYVIFTAIGKSNVKISQSIGRAMRLHKNKEEAVIYDISDNTEYSMDHLKQRLKLYRKDKIPFEIKRIKL